MNINDHHKRYSALNDRKYFLVFFRSKRMFSFSFSFYGFYSSDVTTKVILSYFRSTIIDTIICVILHNCDTITCVARVIFMLWLQRIRPKRLSLAIWENWHHSVVKADFSNQLRVCKNGFTCNSRREKNSNEVLLLYCAVAELWCDVQHNELIMLILCYILMVSCLNFNILATDKWYLLLCVRVDYSNE